ncbi:MAG: hypothetical protein R3B84_08635 [Zavarzinella sp.]
MKNTIIERVRAFFLQSMPEEKVTASFNADQLQVMLPDGSICIMIRTKIQMIGILTTSSGPFLEDVYWAISDHESTIFVPQKSADFSSLLSDFQTMPNFNNDAFIDAMCCTEDRLFVCWERE